MKFDLKLYQNLYNNYLKEETFFLHMTTKKRSRRNHTFNWFGNKEKGTQGPIHSIVLATEYTHIDSLKY